MSDEKEYEELHEGQFPGTNTQPVKDGVEEAPQEPDAFGDTDGEF